MASVRAREWDGGDGKTKRAWVVDYVDSKGKRRNRQFKLKKQADAFCLHAQLLTSQGIQASPPNSGTVAAAAEAWLKHCRSNDLEPTTMASYEQHVRLHIIPLCGSRRLRDLTRVDAEEIRDDLVAKSSAEMAPRLLRSMRAIFGEAERLGHVGHNVFRDVRIKRNSRRKPRIVIPLKGELRGLLRASTVMSDPMILPLFLVLLFCGLRASEARGLTWRTVDLKRGYITIEQRADARNIIGPPKSESGFRSIPIPRKVQSTLRVWKLQCPQSRLNLVFPSIAGRVMSHAYMNKTLFYSLQIKAGVFDEVETLDGVVSQVRYALHALRHAAASLWIERRVSAKMVQTWMGHSSIQVTFDLYGHLFDKADLDVTAATAIEAELMGHSDAAWTQQA